MTTYQFADVQGTTIAFDPAVDVLNFGTGSAAQLRFVVTGSDLQVQMGAQWVTLAATTYGALGTGDLTFADGSLFLVGTAGGDALAGSAGADFLDGRGGADTLTGGAGGDIYVVDSGGDVVVEGAGGGIDQVRSVVSHTLAANVEELWLRNAGAINGYGNALDNTIYAGDGNNILNGGAGNDTVSYRYALAGVSAWLALATAQATGGSGSDTLVSIENLTGSDFNDLLRGNSLGNRLDGGLGNDTLDGGGGADTLVGGNGNDTFIVDNAGDVVQETTAGGTGGNDLVQSSLASTTLGANIEQLRLTSAGAADGYGNTLDNIIYAGAGNNVINGSAGFDTISYRYATAGVAISLATTSAQATGGSGTDTLLNFENATGSAYADALTGNGIANVLDGGMGNDTLRGGVGIDTLIGGDGNDTYQLDSLEDVLVETATGGTADRVEVTFNYTLTDANLEEARALGYSAITLTGNAADNVLVASWGACTLDGAGGSDTASFEYQGLIGAGTRAYLALGYAEVGAYAGYSGSATHAILVNIENLRGSLVSDTLVGDANANRLEGLDGYDVLDGGAGVDTMIGGEGGDTYYVRDAGDTVIETGSLDPTDVDRVLLWLGDYTLTAGVESVDVQVNTQMHLAGNGADNYFYLGTGATTLDGGAGTDTLDLGRAPSAVVVDMVDGTVLRSGIQVVGFTGIESISGTGYADHMVGDAGDNRLWGAGGADTLEGGAGNDQLYGGQGDLLVGGAGADRIDVTGGSYYNLSDRIVYLDVAESTAEAMDSITGFYGTVDRIDLSAIDANVQLAGDQAFTFIGTNAFSEDATGQLRYDLGTYRIMASTDADLDAELVIEMVGITSMAASNFVL
jgi:Ca2+-binding RTX toxin-like protein